MRTFLLLHLDSEGGTYSEIAETLVDMGFQPHADGGYDFVYDWGREATVEESLSFADRVQAALQGQRTFFRIESIEG
ncbi:MAG TPA: hypothetical protein VGS23_07725 [Thermoplasmata archaeon]|nr:hypothetical protein [Thermoplasmata archaeon]